MKNRSAKNKGLRFENYLVEYLRETLDKKAYRVAASGAGLDKNDLRLPNWNIEIEAKNWDKQIDLRGGLEQAERQKTTGNTPVLMMRHPDYAEFKKTIVVMDLDDFVELLLRDHNVEVAQELPDDLKWRVKRLKDAAHEVFKELSKD